MPTYPALPENPRGDDSAGSAPGLGKVM